MTNNIIVTRTIDELNRIVLPSEARNHLGLSKGMNVKVSIEGNKIILVKDEEKNAEPCITCGK
ncbi:MAG: AbrB/MazE/SpoVT family DNA-binding domain-containing protein [Defluviitaleaceae bacterium]|nr:AbrB/MazE/SpoVT family DNA-binding domain-containing protein [Defluviitaleaceae bacterium]